MSKSLKKILKLLVSIGMLALILSVVDFRALIVTLKGLPISAVVLVIVGYAVSQVVSAYKWWVITRHGGISGTYGKALKAYFMGMFVNSFGFGIVGGDVARGLLIAGKQPKKTEAFASVAADRFHGLATLALLGVIATTVWGMGSNFDQLFIYLLWGIAFSIGIAWFAGPVALLKLIPEHSRLRKKVEEVVKVFPNNARSVLWITVVSMILHLLQISLHWIMARGVGADIPFSIFLVVIPFVNILSSLPISWNGLGVRENAYRFFLAPAFLTAEQAVAFGAIWFLSVTVCSGIGGIIALATGDLAALDNDKPPYKENSFGVKANANV